MSSGSCRESEDEIAEAVDVGDEAGRDHRGGVGLGDDGRSGDAVAVAVTRGEVRVAGPGAASAPGRTLDAAAEKVAAHGANPWVFAADARHFWQFAGAAEKAAREALTEQEHTALLGPWDDSDFWPESFGYAP